MMARRNRLEILGSILKICKADGSYLEWLIKHGYLVKEDRIYKTTPTGLKLLENLDDLASKINDAA